MRRCVWLSAAALVLLQTCAWAQLLVPTVVDTFYLPLGRVPAFRSNVTTAAAVAVEQLGKALTPAWLTDAKERLAKRGIVFPSVTRVAVTPVWRLSLLVSTIPLPTSPAEAANWLQEPALGVTQALFSPYSIDWRLQFLYGADYQAGLVNPAVVNTAGGVVAVPRGSVGRRRHRRRRRALHQQPNDDERIVAQLLAQCLEEAPDVYRGRSLTSPAHPQQGRRHLAQASGALSQLPASLLQGLATAWEAHHQGAINATLAGWGALLSLVLRQSLLGYVDVLPSVRWGESWGVTQIPTVDTTFFFRAGFDIATGAIKTLSLGSPNASTPVRRPVLGVVGHHHRRRQLHAAAPSPSPAPGPESGPTSDGAEFTTRVPPNQVLPPSLRATLVALLQAVSADSQAMAAAVQPIIVQLETTFQVTSALDIVLQPYISGVPGQLSFVLPNTADKWAKFLMDPTLGLLLQSQAGFSIGLSFSVSIISNLLAPPKILPLLEVAVPSQNATGRRRLHALQRQQSPEAVFQAALALAQQHTGISARLQELFLVFGIIDFKAVAVQFLAGAQHRADVSERSIVHHPLRGAGVEVDAAIVNSAFTIASWTITAASSALVGFSPSLPKAAGG